MSRPRRLLTGALLALVTSAAAAAGPANVVADLSTSANWVQSAAQGPSARSGAYMAYDSARQKTVLFGGFLQTSTAYTFYNDTWEFDGTAWTQINTSSAPPAAANGQMVYDSARGVSVLFGGGDNSGYAANVTWEWNGSVWTPRFTANRPPGRVWFGMTYDTARHVTVLFGGSLLTADTWEYDGSDWRQVMTAHSPPPRYGTGLAYDPTRGKTVMFGGHDNVTGRLNDTWEYDGTDWTQIFPTTSPAPRFLHSIAFDPALGKVVMFGGDYIVPGSLGPNSETWTYDGANWQQLAPANAPSPRSMAPAAYDSAHAGLVLFGGSIEVGDMQSLGDTWSFAVPESAATLSASAVQFPTEPVLSTTSQDVTLTNTGTAPLAVSSIDAGGDFATSDTCPRAPTTIAIGGSCAITINFTPSSDATSTSTLTVADNAPTGSQSIPLSGSGAWGQLTASSDPLAFGEFPINPAGVTASTVETLTFPGPATILTGFNIDAPWNVVNLDCPMRSQVGGGAACHIRVDFDPGTAGSYSGLLRIGDNEPGGAHPVGVSATADPIPATISLNVSGPDPMPTFGRTINAAATTSAAFGTATFTFNGHVFAPVDLAGTGTATLAIPLDDTTVPAGAATYSLVVTVHPTDGVHSDSSASQSVTVVPATVQLAWAGSELVVAGNPVTLAASVSAPPGDHQIWVRFDVADSTGSTASFYAQEDATWVATTSVSGLAPGAYTTRATIVAASGSAAPNPYFTSQYVPAAFAVSPDKGGYVAGGGQQSTTTVGFEFTPGPTPGGALAWIGMVQVTGSDGQQHLVWQIVTSTSVTSVDSHSHTASVAGQATIAFYDPATGAHLSGLDQSSPFTLTVQGDGSVLITTTANGENVSLAAGSGVNHL